MSDYEDEYDYEEDDDLSSFEAYSSDEGNMTDGDTDFSSVGNMNNGSSPHSDWPADDLPVVSLQTVDFRPVHPSELLKNIYSETNKLSAVLGFDQDDCYILLHYFNWNSEKLMEQCMDHCDEARQKAGLLSLDHENKINQIVESETFVCDVCCDERNLAFSMECGHKYCDECYIYYLKEKVFANARLIKCLEPSCHLNLRLHKDIKVISDYMVANSITADVKEIEEAKKLSAKEKVAPLWSDDESSEDEDSENSKAVPEPEEDKTLFERYEEGSIKSYVECHSNYKWCPSPDCKGMAKLSNVSKNYLKELSSQHKNNFIPIVSCPFEHSFCFICNYENHIPVPCWITKMWIQKCKDDSETANWISANTQSCPKCETSTEKNGGCNHMTCKKCKYEYCWICMGPWSKHGSSYYNCSMYNANETQEVRAKQDLSRSSLKRYLHYYNHFTTQEQSMKGDNLFCADIENKVMEIQEKLKEEVSYIELQFYKQSVDILLRCRRTLKWSYALMYYLKDNNFTTILADNQLHLSNNVEKLSKLFEIFQPKQILSKKREFNSVSGYLLKREKLFIECAIEGIMKGELTFIVDES